MPIGLNDEAVVDLATKIDNAMVDAPNLTVAIAALTRIFIIAACGSASSAEDAVMWFERWAEHVPLAIRASFESIDEDMETLQ